MHDGYYDNEDYSACISPDDLSHSDKKTQKEYMRIWFFRHYDNPGNACPYESQEGGYQFIWGGPYDANDVLSNEFSGIVADNIIEELAQELEEEQSCDEWSGVPDQDESDAVGSATNFHDSFKNSVDNIRLLAEIEVPQHLKQHFLQMLHVSIITSLEAFLCEACTNSLFANQELLHKFVESYPEFSKRKIPFNTIFQSIKSIESYIRNYLVRIVWHNLDKVESIYECVWGKFPKNRRKLKDAITLRHDIVHRNGKTEDGTEIALDEKDVQSLIDNVSGFVDEINEIITR
jgi:hypothetical protein